MKKIGLVNIDTSHPSSFAQKMAAAPEMDMQYAMVYNDGFRGVDEFNYGVHVGEILSEIAGAKAVSCKFTGEAVRDGMKCEIYTVRFENGVIGTYCTYLSGWRPFNVSIMTTKTSYCFKIDSSKIYVALLTRISEMLKTGERRTADVEKILNVTEFMLCGKRSRDFETEKK